MTRTPCSARRCYCASIQRPVFVWIKGEKSAYLRELRRGEQAGELLRGVDFEWPAIALGEDGHARLLRALGEKGEGAVAEDERPLDLHCQVLQTRKMNQAAPNMLYGNRRWTHRKDEHRRLLAPIVNHRRLHERRAREHCRAL